ncbi:MAG: toll/interleukin-1 receptor domain-containing protein [Desulfarculus sp.]|nr:toll/interleukin-1 receptor domain-containing protein [Desulfarculus sp.]
MANPEHLAVLQQGVEAWDRWRAEHPDIMPDLGKAELSGANLGEANLNGANLAGADLRYADLSWATLHSADLGGADLRRVDLGWANLFRANLVGANLVGASLNSTPLDGTDLSGASIGYTLLGNVDLSQVKGLEKVEHQGPSSIGLDTIYRSRGKIPESFLRGAGVPEEFIVYMRSLVNNPIEYYSCFISYSPRDKELAQRLYADLKAANVRCWFAPHYMAIGDDILDRIDETIRHRDKLLLILSRNFINSTRVENEVETALEEETRRSKVVLFPIRLDDAVMTTDKAWAAHLRRTRHIGDFTRWKDHDAYKKALDRLLRDLKVSAQVG